MAATPEIFGLSREYILREVIPNLPHDVVAVSLEIIAWHIQVHTYQHTVFTSEVDEYMDEKIEMLAPRLPMREGEPWQSTLARHRVDRCNLLEFEGELVFDRRAEL